MTFKELMKKYGSIYIQNLKGYFRTMRNIVTAKYEGTYLAASAILFVSVVFMPINLFVFAPFKALFDLFTRRKELPEVERTQLIEKIETMEEAKMESLVQTINNYTTAKSYESRELIGSLKGLSKLTANKVQLRVSKKRLELQEDQFDGWESFTVSNVEARLSTVALNETNERRLSDYTAERTSKWAILKMNGRKALIEAFLRNPVNHGKKMERVIDGFFKPNEPAVIPADKRRDHLILH